MKKDETKNDKVRQVISAKKKEENRRRFAANMKKNVPTIKLCTK